MPGLCLVFICAEVSAQNKAAFVMSKSEGCAPLSVNFNDQSTGNVTSRVWNLGNGNISNHNVEVGSNFSTPGTYNITLTVTFSNGQVSTATQQLSVYEKPTADFIPEVQQGCGVTNVQFTPSASAANNNNTVYEWDFGDGQYSGSGNPVHQYAVADRYTVKLTTANGAACKSTFSTQVVVPEAEQPMQAGIISAPVNACMQTTLEFKGAVTNAEEGNYALHWDFGDHSSSGNMHTTHQYNAAGTYRVRFITSSSSGICSDTAEQLVTIQPKITTGFSADALFSCEAPLSVQFTNQTTGGADLDYKWYFGDNAASAEKDPQHTYTAPGNRTVTLVAKDRSGTGGCYDSLVKTQYIRVGKPSSGFYYAPSGGCGPLKVNFTANIGNTYAADPVRSYTWNWGDGNSLTTTTGIATHTFLLSATYDVTLSIETQNGCTVTSPVRKVTVTPTCNDDGIISEGGAFVSSRNCSDKYTVTLTDTSSDHSVVHWNFGDLSPEETGNPVTHTFPGTQKSWTVTLTRNNNNTNQVETVSKNILIVDESAGFTIANPSTCTNVDVRLNTLGINAVNIKKFIWDFGDGSPRRTINNNLQTGVYNSGSTTYRYTQSGVYSPKLIIEDKLGCLDSISLDNSVTINGPKVDFTATPAISCSSPVQVSFTSTSVPNSGVPIESWEWTFGNNTAPFITTRDSVIKYSYIANGDYSAYSVKLKIKDQDGCVNEITKTNLVQVTSVKASFKSADTLVCGQHQIGFENNSVANNAEYVWHWGDGATTTVTNRDPVTHEYAKDGIYDVKLVVTPLAGGCRDSVSRRRYIKIVKPQADFNIGDTLQCVPAAIGFENTSAYSLEYTWVFDNGNTYQTQNPPPQTYTAPGIYTATVIAKGINGCTDTATRTFRIKGPLATLSLESAAGGCTPFTFGARISGTDISTYSWDFGDGTAITASETDSVVAHVYTFAGSYTPSVILTNAEGCTNNISVAQPIKAGAAEASFTIDRDKFCDSGTVIFKNTSATGTHFIQQLWNFGNGSFNGHQPPPWHYNQPGTYYISLIVETDFGCRDTIKADFPVTVSAKPGIHISGAASGCIGDTLLLEASVRSADYIPVQHWLLNKQHLDDSTAINFPLTSTGTYRLAFTATTQQGCADTLFHPVAVHALPVPATGPDTVVCSGSPVQLHATGGKDYYWESEEAIQHPAVHNAIAIPQKSALYVVKVTNNYGCIQKDTVAITVEDPVNLIARNEYHICRGDEVRLSASGNTQSFSWYPRQELSNPNSPAPVARPAASANYLVVGHSTNICPDDSVNVHVEVLDNPVVKLGNDTAILGGIPFTLNPQQVSNNVVRYEWLPPPGLSCSNCRNPVALPEEDQQYILNVATAEGCKSSDSIALTLLCNRQAIYIPNAFTPNGDGLNDWFYVKGFGLKTVNYLRVFDRWGKEVFSRRNFTANNAGLGWDGRLPAGAQPAGTSTYIYAAEVVCSEGIPITLTGTLMLIR
ncbi:MAG: PKD domain-containing protein [Chitinophagaceae bacterium]|nr:PKD domain-containing protein [Chitinophagaceae bacterium]